MTFSDSVRSEGDDKVSTFFVGDTIFVRTHLADGTPLTDVTIQLSYAPESVRALCSAPGVDCPTTSLREQDRYEAQTAMPPLGAPWRGLRATAPQRGGALRRSPALNRDEP